MVAGVVGQGARGVAQATQPQEEQEAGGRHQKVLQVREANEAALKGGLIGGRLH